MRQEQLPQYWFCDAMEQEQKITAAAILRRRAQSEVPKIPIETLPVCQIATAANISKAIRQRFAQSPDAGVMKRLAKVALDPPNPFNPNARRRPGTRRRFRLAVAAAPLALAGCLYGFAGGGLPSSIKTVAVLPFDNQTSEPTLTREVDAAVRDAVQGRLGLRQASERQADAVVRGTISRYEPDLPTAYTGNGQQQVTVTRRMVQITLSVEIVEQRTGKKLWERSGLLVHGDYESNREAEGRQDALNQLVTNIVEGAQSQW